MRLVVFDYDGTLVDSQGAIVATMQVAFAELGQPAPDAAAVRGVIGLALETAIARLAALHGASLDAVDPALVTALAAAYRRGFLERRTRGGAAVEPLFEGIREAIEAFARPDRFLGIATGKNRRGLLHGLEIHRLGQHFSVLKTADDGPSKPHPAILQQAIAETGVEPAETLVIGDTAFDMEMARNAGAHALGVAWGYHPAEELIAAGARGIAAAPADLVGLVEELACAG